MTDVLPFAEAPEGLKSVLDLPTGHAYTGVSEAVYHRKIAGIASKHALDDVLDALAIYEYGLTLDQNEGDTKALAFGRAWHSATLTPDVFVRDYVVEPDFGHCRANAEAGVTPEEGKANKLRRDAWRKENADRTHVTAKEYRDAQGMAERIHKHSRISRLLAAGTGEATILWREPMAQLEGGLLCKCRPDWTVTDGGLIVVDLKSAESAGKDAFRRAASNYGYHRIEAFYRMGFQALGVELEAYLFAVSSKNPPYLCAIYDLEPEDVEAGRQDVLDGLERLARAVRSGFYPGYPEEVTRVKLLPYARRAAT